MDQGDGTWSLTVDQDKAVTATFAEGQYEVTVTVDEIGRVGEIIEAGVLAGANRVFGLEFTVREPLAFRAAAL